MMSSLSELEIIRRNKLQELLRLGIDPYPAAAYPVSHKAAEIKQHSEEKPLTDVCLAGRIMSIRDMGKAAFAVLQDSSGRIQLYLKRDDFPADQPVHLYTDIWKKYIDIGDIIGVKGFVFTTKTGELSVHVTHFDLLSKSLKPLPIVKEKEGAVFDAVSDAEFRYRRRYVDLTINPEVQKVFRMRTQIYNEMRRCFNEMGYLEVETPILQSIPGGANARPFITHHNALDIPLYLRIANELYLKRLIVGGFDGVYEFAKDFRNEGMDRTHNPEFTIMELYVAYKDYLWLMTQTEQWFERIARALHNDTKVRVEDGVVIDFKAPYSRVPVYEAIQTHTGTDIRSFSVAQLRDFCHSLHLSAEPYYDKAKLVDMLFSEKCERHYIQPTFITDHPVEMSPLTKKHRSQKGLVERFELYVNGKEIANAYSELNDPVDQKIRFEAQAALKTQGDEEAMFVDYDFLRALEYGMPPAAGIGMGMDRLVMLMTGQPSIQDVLFFPQMRPESKD